MQADQHLFSVPSLQSNTSHTSSVQSLKILFSFCRSADINLSHCIFRWARFIQIKVHNLIETQLQFLMIYVPELHTSIVKWYQSGEINKHHSLEIQLINAPRLV